jgi:hypothetical protein
MQEYRYARLFCDGEGESHFEDVTAVLEPAAFAPPAPPLNVASLGDATTLSLVGGRAGWGGDRRHPSPARQMMCPLAGRFEVTASDGTSRQFAPGSLLLLEDTSGKGHSTRLLTEEVVVAATRLASEAAAEQA